MNSHRLSSFLTWTILAATLPLTAQTPLFTDGPAFGGGKVFSEGRNPLGNSARFEQPASGWYLTYLDGDQRSKDQKALLTGLSALDPAALAKAGEAPWSQRTRAFGIAGLKEATNFSYTREELNSVVALPDLDPAHLGALGALANSTAFEGRRASVDRIALGGGSGGLSGSHTAFGTSLRIEQWRYGLQVAAVNPGPGQIPISDLDNGLLSSKTTARKTTTYALDMGFTMELAQGLRIGLTADQLNAKHLWDVYLQPQFRAGLQFDLGGSAKLAVETDINAAARMPFPQKQQTASASLRFASSQAVTFVLGAERRKIADTSITRGGITLELRTASFLLGLALQVGQDSPLRGATLMVN